MYVEVSKDYPLTYQINDYLMKQCTKCNEVKELTEFHKAKACKGGYHTICRSCSSAYAKQYREKNKELVKRRKSEYYQKNRDEIKEKSRKNYQENREDRRKKQNIYREKNKDKINKVDRAWQKANRKKINKHKRDRYANDPAYRTLRLLSKRLYKVLSGNPKRESTMELIGCDRDHLIFHLESQFTDDMSWENQGEWHIDHIQPCASFDQTDLEQRRICWHYTNLQPLWAEDNLRKRDRFSGDHQVRLL